MPRRRAEDGRRLDIAEYICMVCKEYPAYDVSKCLDEEWFVFWDLIEYSILRQKEERKFIASIHGVKYG